MNWISLPHLAFCSALYHIFDFSPCFPGYRLGMHDLIDLGTYT